MVNAGKCTIHGRIWIQWVMRLRLMKLDGQTGTWWRNSVWKKNEKPSHVLSTKNFSCLYTKPGISSPKLRDSFFDRRNLGSQQRKTPGSPQYMGQDRATCWGHPGVNFSPWSLQHTPFHHMVVTGPNVRSESIVGWLGRCGSHVESGGKVRMCSYMKKEWEHGRLRIEDPSFGDVILGWFQRFFFHLENERRWAH